MSSEREGGAEATVPGGPLGHGPTRWAATNEAGEHRFLEEVGEPAPGLDEVREMAQRIGRRLALRPSEQDRSMRRGSGMLRSVPYRWASDDIDLDRTLEVLSERPVPEDTDIVVRERRRGRRAVALIVDVSGSMRGEKSRIAAAAVGALTATLRDDEFAVVAFWRDAVLVKPMNEHLTAGELLDRLWSLPAKGLTNVEFGLTAGLAELQRARARRRSAILLSDALHNAGPDPRPAAARFGPLHLLLEVDGEHDADLARDLARLGGGAVEPIRDHRQVAPAVNRMLR